MSWSLDCPVGRRRQRGSPDDRAVMRLAGAVLLGQGDTPPLQKTGRFACKPGARASEET